MGYSMSVYRLDLEALRARIARQDQTLYDELKAKHADDLAGQAGEIGEEDFEAPDEMKGCLFWVLSKLFGSRPPAPKPTHPQPTEEPTPELLLKHIVFGLPKFHGGYSMYGYQFLWVVQHLGVQLDSEAFESMRSSSGWTGIVSEALNGSGIPKEVFEFEKMLLNRGAPIPLPAMTDFPYIGYLEAAEVKAFLEVMKGVDKAKAIALIGEQEYGAMALENIQAWLDEASAANEGIVAFYY